MIELELPIESVDNQPQVKPLTVLDWRLKEDDNTTEVLIQWEGLFLEDVTWKSY